ncbi:hypothetical protein KO489_01370 [Reinekea forsetii]|nr:hypothetical protein [Reinekea forsetii]
MKKYKFEIISLIVISLLSALYYYDTGEVKIIGIMVAALIALNISLSLISIAVKKFYAKGRPLKKIKKC